MSWLTPITGLILAAAVVPPLLLLYFLKLRRQRRPIACTLLWKRSVEDLQANAPFQRLRRNLLLFMQLIVLALLAAAVAQPRLHAGGRRGGKTVILVDNSASMNATDAAGDGSRLEEAKVLAKERIETLFSGGLFSGAAGETMIIAFGDGAEIMCRFSDSKPQLLSAIDRIGPTDGQTRVDQALTLARAYTTNVNPDQPDRLVGEPATLELYSDGRIADLPDQVLRGEALRYYPLGRPETGNVAITAISVERPFDRPTAVQVFVSLANFGLEAVACDIQLSVDGTARAIEEVPVGPAARDEERGSLTPGRYNVVFTPFEQPRGAVIEVANLRPDALAVDNVAQVVVAPPKALRVLLVAPNGRRVESVLEGLSLEALELVRDPEQYEQMAERGELERFDVIVLDTYQPKQMPPARYLVLGPPPPLEGLNPYGDGEHQIVLEWRDDHPALRNAVLDNLYIARHTLLEPADDVRVLAEGSTSPIIVAVARGPMQLVYCTFDPLDSNWPFQRSFVYFVVDAVDFLGHAGEGLTDRGFRPGEALTARLPQEAGDIELRLPDGAVVPLDPMDPAMLSWGPLQRAGLHVLSWREPGRDERGERPMAVNPVSGVEGDIASAPAITIGRDNVAGTAADDATYTPLWPWALGLCLAVLMLEWWVYHRKTFI